MVDLTKIRTNKGKITIKTKKYVCRSENIYLSILFLSFMD